MYKITSVLVLLGLHLSAFAQFRHYDFVGAGHSNEIIVASSSNSSNTNAAQTIDGFNIQNNGQLKDASRFLAQATFGGDWATIDMVAAMGYEAWLDEQFSLPNTGIHREMHSQSLLMRQEYADEIENEEEQPDPERVVTYLFGPSWFTNNLTLPDVLRQRMAFILSQIFVINRNSDVFEDIGELSSRYYDLLLENSFKNYEELLMDVTLSPSMGNFLSHYNNPKANPSLNIHPDENYAREIMQLFSIGLWELSPDGTPRINFQGQRIPTYTNADIKEFAQVFTGLGPNINGGEFGEELYEYYEDLATLTAAPMRMYDDHHDTSTKELLNGYILPAGQSGMDDIRQTISHLATHDNTAPFISKSVIKFMTTSNPSASYIRDVAATFKPAEKNNFQAVIKAILLHPEARNCNTSEHYTFGKLREPMVRIMNFLRAFSMSADENGDYIAELYCLGDNIGQSPLNAPSVFNFFLPDYQAPGAITMEKLVSPEFQILNSTNAIGLINDINVRTVKRGYFIDNCYNTFEEEAFDEEEFENQDPEYIPNFEYQSPYRLDYSQLVRLASESNHLVDHLDILLANGLLSTGTKAIIVDAISQLGASADRIRMALYLILISPEYSILK